MAGKGINGVAVAVGSIGGLLAYSGIKGIGVSDALRQLIAGEIPQSAVNDMLGGPNPPGPGDIAPGGNDFSTIAGFMMTNLGFTLAGTAGALGNISVESSFSTRAYNAREGAIGYCQWEKGRRTGLDAYARLHGLSETDARAQLGWMRAELLSGYGNVYLKMRSASDPAVAAAYWDEHYEISDGSTRSTREARARGYYVDLQQRYGPH